MSDSSRSREASREAFEKAVLPFPNQVEYEMKIFGHTVAVHDFLRTVQRAAFDAGAAWSRSQALEEAAQACESMSGADQLRPAGKYWRIEFAERVRALKEQK